MMFVLIKFLAIFALFHQVFGQREFLLFDDLGNKCITDIDLMLVLDGSGTVGNEDFEKVKNWVKNVSKSMEIDRGFVQIGVVQYSYFYPSLAVDKQPYVRTEIKLGEHQNLDDFESAVNEIEYQGFQTYTAHAIRKTLEVDFSEFPPNRHPEAKRTLVLVTDGKADDSMMLEEVVKKAEHEYGVNMYAVGVGNYNLTELQIITHNHSKRIFRLERFEDLSQVIASLERDVHESCDCDWRGRFNDSCEECSRQCYCKPYVEGRRCDRCVEDYYGIDGGKGCYPCNCHLAGSTNTSCNQETGQCDCVTDPPAYGRRCNECPPFHYGTYPECNACDCNGFSTSCDRDTGECIDCTGGRIGFNCERCRSGYFISESGQCRPCLCNGNIDPFDPTACDRFTGRCVKCLHNTAGESCEDCKDGYFGDARIQTCQRCNCDLTGTDASTCDRNDCVCDKDSGQCKCLANVIGRICGECTPEHWKAGLIDGCIACGCSETGSKNSSCDQETGHCDCKDEYRGRQCGDCAQGFAQEGSGDTNECKQIQTTTTTTTTTTTPSTTTTTTPSTTTTTTPSTSTTTTPSTTTTTTTTATTTTERTPPVITQRSTTRSTTRRTKPVKPNWKPCSTCNGGYWPSYCQGWYCRRRWPHYQFSPSRRRCYSWNWGCRSSVEYSMNQNYQQQPSSSSWNTQYYRRPTYYRGYYHHTRSGGYRPRVRYNLYRNN